MNSYKSFLLIPNHSMGVNGDTIVIESAEANMMSTVSEHFQISGIAAFSTTASNTSLSGKLARANFAIHSLSKVEHTGLLQKLFNYLVATLLLPWALLRYDMIYIFCPGYCGLVASLWARLLRKPYGLYLRGTWLNKHGETSFWWRTAFSGAKFMVVTGESFKHRLLKYCRNVANEVPLTALTPDQIDLTTIRDRSPFRMIFAGRLNDSKGVRDAVKAIALLKQWGKPVELLIAGGGTPEELAILNQLIDDLGVRDAVHLLGHIPSQTLADAYKRSAIFVFPSYYAEGFPRVLYEAMMYQLAIVTCAMPGTEGFLIEGVNCVFTPPAAPQELAGNLRRLMDDHDFAKRLAKKARKDVEDVYKTFTEASHAHQILKFLDA